MKKRPHPSLGYKNSRHKRASRRVWSREKARVRRGGHRNPALMRPGKMIVVRLVAPREMDVGNIHRRGPTARFLHEIRDHSRRKGVAIEMDFSGIELVYPSGAVLLLAEIDRAVLGQLQSHSVRCKRRQGTIADQVLQQIGIYERLGIACEVPPDAESVRHWRSASGVLSDGAKGGSILESYEGRLAEGISKGLYEGIVEAMTNTLHHAYLGQIGTQLRHRIGRRWWMLSQERDGLLSVAICDLGIGIPRSLPRSPSFPWESIKRLWQTLRLDGSDASAIKVALQLGKTRTEQKGRGKGLSEIVEAVRLSERGRVIISSNKGVFTSAPNDNYVGNHSHSIRGTLIHWQVPIAEGVE